MVSQGCTSLARWVLNTEHASCHPCGVQNFEVAPGFLENLWPGTSREYPGEQNTEDLAIN